MKLILFLLLSLTFVRCNENKSENKDQKATEKTEKPFKYQKFLKVPAYIENASGSNKEYYDAYDETLKLWKVAYKELYIGTSRGITHVTVSGPTDGEPVVLLHGMNASSTMWYPNIAALSKDYQVFAIDYILEPGKSNLLQEIETPSKVMDWYNEVLYALDLKYFHLIGASEGGYLAAKLALKDPKRIKKMILLSPAQTLTWIKPNMELIKLSASKVISKDKELTQTLSSMSSNVSNIAKEFLTQHELGHQQGSENKFVPLMIPFSKKQLKTLKMPVLVLVGDQDLMNNEKTVEVANQLHRGKGEIIPNAGHFLSVDQAEVVNEKMVKFLK